MASYMKADPMRYPTLSESDHKSAAASLAQLDGTPSKSDPGQDRVPSYSLASTSDSVDTYPPYPPPVTIPMGPYPGGDSANKSPLPSSSDDRRCRICFEGETEPEMGRLISPCLCKGSSRYIHLQCLQNWRELSQRSDSYYQCDTCRYHYSFSRPLAAKVVGQKWFVHLLTTVCMILLIYGLGWAGREIDARGLWHWKNMFGPVDSSTWTRVLRLDGADYLSGVALTAALGLLAWIVDVVVAAKHPREGTRSNTYAGCCTIPAHGCCGYGCGWGAESGEGAIVLIVVVIVFGGIYAAFYGVYRVFASLNQKAFDRMTEAILEVN